MDDPGEEAGHGETWAVDERPWSSSSPDAGGGVGLDLPPWPKVDFAKYGPVEVQPLSRIKKLSKGNLSRNWVMIPHVTQHDEADITDLEAFRKAESELAKKRNVKLTMLPFIMKAVVATLKAFPTFNASLDPAGERLDLMTSHPNLQPICKPLRPRRRLD